MSGKKIQSKTEVTAIYQQAINGAEKYLPDRTLDLNGKPVSSEAVVGILQQHIDAIQATIDTHTAWLQAAAKLRAMTKTTSAPTLAALRHYVAAKFGENSDEYREFGFQPPKPRIASPEAKVIGAAKLRATRKARKTMGRRQRLAITGTVPSAIALPVGNAPGATPAEPLAATPGAAPAQPTEPVTVTTPTNGGTATH
jgi:hypothetical protein